MNRSKSPTDAALLKALGATLGVLQQPPRAFLQAGAGLDESRIAALIEERRAAKARGDYRRARTRSAATWRARASS